MTVPVPPSAGAPAVSSVSPVVAVSAVSSAAPVAGAAPASPPTASALSLSTQAQQALRLQIFQTLVARLVTEIQSGAAPQWPSQSVAPALREMLATLIAQATAHLPRPLQLVAVQAWPQSWVNAVLPGSGAPATPATGNGGAAPQNVTGAASAAAPGMAPGAPAGADATALRLPPLQNWLVQQGVLQTPQGERGFALTLQVPQPWAQLQAQAQAMTASTSLTPPSAPGAVSSALHLAAPAQPLESGTLALVLQGQGPKGEVLRTSALLWLDFQPLPPSAPAQGLQATLAGALASAQVAQQAQLALQPRNDPWLQLAALQASGQQPRDDQRLPERRTGLCTQLGCPYRGKASCAQPFCAEMNRVWAAARVGPTAT